MQVTVYDATGQNGLGGPLRALPCAEVEVVPGWSVADVLGAAGHMRYSTFALVTAEVEMNVSVGEAHTNWVVDDLFGVDDAGALKFQGGDHVSWAEFVRAAEQSLYAGDPSRIVVYPYGVAGGPSPDGLWNAVQWLFDNRDIGFVTLHRLADTAVYAAAIAEVARHTSAGRRKQIAEKWRRQGITAPRLIRSLARCQQWDPERVQKLFDLTELEAPLMLTNAGYQRGADGLWRLSNLVDGENRRRTLEQIGTRAYDNIEVGWSDDFPIDDDQDEAVTSPSQAAPIAPAAETS